VRYAFIAAHLREWPVAVTCEVLGVSRSGFYRWQSREPSPRERQNQQLLRLVEQIHGASRRTYGSPRVHQQLVGLGHAVGRGRVERLMQRHGIKAKTARRFRVTTDSSKTLSPAPDRVRRVFRVERPNRVWASDVTYLWTREGWLYLGVTLDLCSRRVVGWSMADRLDGELSQRALRAAVVNRVVAPGLIHHSDQGAEYSSNAFRALLASHGMTQSMSRRGNCWDNAVVESFFHTLKAELRDQGVWPTRAAARAAVFDWIEVFYNRQRMHSTLGYQTPAAYEAQIKSA
jgi:transposase InsO family protein